MLTLSYRSLPPEPNHHEREPAMTTTIATLARSLVSFAIISTFSAFGLGGCVGPQEPFEGDAANENLAEYAEELAVGAPSAMAGTWDFHVQPLPSGSIEHTHPTLEDVDGTVTENGVNNPYSDWVSLNGQTLLFFASPVPGAPAWSKPNPVSALYGVGTSSAMAGIRFGMGAGISSAVFTANRPGGAQVTPSAAAPLYSLVGTWTQSVDWGLTGSPITYPVVFAADGTFQVNGGLNETGRYYTYRIGSGEQYFTLVFSNNNAVLGGRVTCPGSLRIDGISMQTMTYPENPYRQGTFVMTQP